MKMQRCQNVRLSALCLALALVSVNVTAQTSSSTMGCTQESSADGNCDLMNNIEDCGYDGGDCCECTCVSTSDYTCGDNGGYSCLDTSASCVDDDDLTTLPEFEDYSDTDEPDYSSCLDGFIGDGDCDLNNNNEDCAFDGGDCCECTCVSTGDYTCGDPEDGGYSCIDPSATCVDDDDVATNPDTEYIPSSGEEDEPFSCFDLDIGDGDCDPNNNKEECDYDGGDCCECTCVSSYDVTCGEDSDFECIDPTADCVDGYVEAGTKTSITATANAYDTRPGPDSDMVGCWEDGCGPELSRDGISDDDESRWSCAQKLVPDGGQCKIEFTFEDPLDIMDVQIAFWKVEERSRTLEAAINGEVIGEFDSLAGATFNTFGIEAAGVNSFTLTSVGLLEGDWISLLEVNFMVEP